MEWPARVTTREATRILNCRKPSDAVSLLFAAGVPFSKCGAAYLWDAAEVERLAVTLHKPTVEARGGEGAR